MKHIKVDGTKFGGKNIKKLDKVCKTKGFQIKQWGTYKQWLPIRRFVMFGQKGISVFGYDDEKGGGGCSTV